MMTTTAGAGRLAAAVGAALALAGCMGTDAGTPRPGITAAGTKGADFGATLVGTRKQLDFRLANSASGFVKVAALEGIAISVTGPGLSVAHSCPTVLEEGESCFISVVYAPGAAVASLTGELRVTSNADAPTVQALAGSAVAALSPAAGAVAFTGGTSTDFGSVAVGQSVTRTFTVMNVGNAADTLTIAGPTQTGWSFDATDCTGAALSAGDSCAVVVRFAPTTTGVSTPTALTITDAYNTDYGGLALQPVGVGN
jgi:hypothetical protein